MDRWLGGWLGGWNNRTLAKPPGYSIYLSFAHFIPIQLSVLNQLLYLAAVYVLIQKLKKILPVKFKFKELFFLLTFNFLIFQPFLFASESNRIYRSSVPIVVFTLLYSIILMSLLHKIMNENSLSVDSFKKRRSIYFDLVGLSLVYGIMSLFRYESFWIILCSVPALVAAFATRWNKSRPIHKRGKGFLRLLLPIPLILLIAYSAPVLTVQELNRSVYGVPLTENYYQGSFSEAINLWSSVDVNRDPRPYVVVSAQQRNAVYEVSRNALLMKPFLESPDNGWNKPACDILKLCDNPGAWFTWQVRDASVSTGMVYSERTFQNFFKEIARDIQKACDVSSFKCTKKSNIVGSKPLGELPLNRMIEYSLSNLKTLLPFKSDGVNSIAIPDTFGAPGDVVEMYHEVVHYERASSFDEKRIKSISKIMGNINYIYIFLNILYFLLGIIGTAIGFIRNFNPDLKFTALFLIGGVISQLIGASIAQISFGTSPGSQLYLLSAYPMLHMLCLLGLIGILAQFSKKEAHPLASIPKRGEI